MNVLTVGDAEETVHRLFDAQVKKAREEGTELNQAAKGDREARDVFLLLLPERGQRRVFLQRIADQSFWPRVKSLIGSPPYSFLHASDRYVLNAAGITRGRSSMASGALPNGSQIGKGHFSDAFGRVYRVTESNSVGRLDSSQLLPWRRIETGGKLLLDVKLKQIGHAKREEIVKRRGNIQILLFPRPADTIALFPVPVLSREGINAVHVRVESVMQRGAGSPVARLRVTVV